MKISGLELNHIILSIVFLKNMVKRTQQQIRNICFPYLATQKMRKSKISRTALILVGRVFDEHNFRDSALYDSQHVHVLRPKKKSIKK